MARALPEALAGIGAAAMSLQRWAARRDAAEKPIREALEAHGARVWSISGRRGLPDLLVLHRGCWHVLAVKTQTKRSALTATEQAGVPWPLVRSVAEALAVLGMGGEGKG